MITRRRLTRTGDLAQHLPNGNIQLLGRNDNQVKIQGYRIDLGEIEAILNQHPAVKDNVIVIRELASHTEVSLFAYVVPGQQQALSTNELLFYLKKKLPNIWCLPLLPFWMLCRYCPTKVDRQKLPLPMMPWDNLPAHSLPHELSLKS